MTSEPSATAQQETDFRGSRRLTGAEEWFWYLVAAVSYIVFGMWHKWLLNWIIGPVWLVAIICIGPPILDGIRSARSGRRSRDAPSDGAPSDGARSGDAR